MELSSLPMYDFPEVRWATEDWWRGLAGAMRAEGIEEAPEALTRTADLQAHWCAPDLLFSQTCGYPLTHALQGRVTLLATPVYDCQGCDGPRYCSLILAREDDPAVTLADFRGRRVAANGRDSQSGYAALRAAIAPLARQDRFFAALKLSGSHLESMAMVQRSDADLCAIDAVSYALARRYRPAAVAGLRQVTASPSAPGLPFITRAAAPADLVKRLRAALFRALADPDLQAARDALFLAGAEVLPPDAYDRILELEREAVALGYAELP